MHMPKILDTLVPEEEVFTRRKQLWHYAGMTILLLVTGLLCTLIGITITEWKNSFERQNLIASYSTQIHDLTEKVLKVQGEQSVSLRAQADTLRETREVIYEVREVLGDVTGMSARIDTSAKRVSAAAKSAERAADKLKKPAHKTPAPPIPPRHAPTVGLPPAASPRPGPVPVYQN